jgi:hypothetical protein
MLGDWIIQTDKRAGQGVELASDDRSRPDVPRRHGRAGPAFRHDRCAAVGLVISAVTHGFIDRRWPVQWPLRKTGSANFAEMQLGVLSADQALHAFFLALMAVLFQVTR